MKLSHFDYKLPKTRLAKHPASERDECKLMLVDRSDQSIKHLIFKDIVDFFEEGDVMLLNNTKVFTERIFGNKEKTFAIIEVFLLRELNDEQRLWDVLVDTARKIRIGNKLYFGEDESLVAEVIDNTTSRGRTLRFLYDGQYDEFRAKLDELGETPLPKYIDRPVEKEDKNRFQTIYAKHEGAVAAPTAGLHFTNELMAEIEYKQIEMVYLTLNIGPGTFKPVRVNQLDQHKMHYEKYRIDSSTLKAVASAKSKGRRIVCVGTTTVRVLEHLAISGELGLNKELPINGFLDGQTSLFIYPGYKFQIADALITNFHLPRSTLLMLVSAFAEQVGENNDGIKLIKESYRKAVEMNYRFYSFGDAMLII